MPWLAWNASALLGISIQNSTSTASLDFTACQLFDTINQAQINASMNWGSSSMVGNSTGMPSATSRATPSATTTTTTSPLPSNTSNRVARTGAEANAAFLMVLGVVGVLVLV
jgi:hypothetical protein